VLKCDNGLGEAPMYNSEEHSLYWLDISGQKLWKFTPGNCFLRLAIFFYSWRFFPSQSGQKLLEVYAWHFFSAPKQSAP
jgi:sugar lactone lactonase YvrE